MPGSTGARQTEACGGAGARLEQLDCHVAAAVRGHLEDAPEVLEHVVLQEELKNAGVVLVAPDEELRERAQRLDERGLVCRVHDLVFRLEQHRVEARELGEGEGGRSGRGRAKEARPEALLRHGGARRRRRDHGGGGGGGGTNCVAGAGAVSALWRRRGRRCVLKAL